MHDPIDRPKIAELKGDFNLIAYQDRFEVAMFNSDQWHSFKYAELRGVAIAKDEIDVKKSILSPLLGFAALIFAGVDSDITTPDRYWQFIIVPKKGKEVVFDTHTNKKGKLLEVINMMNEKITVANNA